MGSLLHEGAKTRREEGRSEEGKGREEGRGRESQEEEEVGDRRRERKICFERT